MPTKSDASRAASKLPAHRARFQALIMANPNHFGNLAGTTFKPKLKLLEDTTYEQLTCVSFNPDLKTLEATLIVKRSQGYGGDLCHAGTREYVRFFVDYGSGPVDAGLAAVEVHDIPEATDCEKASTFPLVYSASLPFDPETDFCGHPVLPEVHAILSWQNPPPPNALDPAHRFHPVWGNELKCHIQVKPRDLIFADVATGLSAEVLAMLTTELVQVSGPVPIPLPDPPPLGVAQLAKLYGGAEKAAAKGTVTEAVPPHRFGTADIAAIASVPGGPAPVLAKVSEWASAGLDWAAAVQAFEDADADVTYEEVECVGLDNGANRLVATFRVKRPFGYSGDLCNAGSTEYVAFWADWDDTCTFEYLGTAKVNVHDITPLPAGGLCYAAVLPVNLDAHARPCTNPRVVRVRAVLSWAVPPSTTDPDALTTWGNRTDAHVQVRPGSGDGTPKIGLIGNVPVPQIEVGVGGSGLTVLSAHFDGMVGGGLVDDGGRQCPFGGLVILGGTLLDTTSPFLGWTYQVQAGTDGIAFPELLTASFTRTDNAFINHDVDPLPDGFFPFFSFQGNIGGTMAYWRTAGVSALRYIRLALKDPGGVVTPGSPMKVQLDNTAPTADIHIDMGGDCKTFPLGSHLIGHFSAIDPFPDFFGQYRIGVLPDPLPSPPMPPGTPAPPVVPATGTSPTGSFPGDDQWSLDTTGMPDCGYVVRMWAVDRSIVNSVPGQHNSSGEKAVGFCLRTAE